MRILVLTSRYTATRDIISEDFGRQTRLFAALKKRGHAIDFFCADYRKLEKKDTTLHGIGVFIRPFHLWHFLGFLQELSRLLTRKKYDVLIATSDPLWGVLGYFVAQRAQVPFVYDLHDNYETYATYTIPGFRYIEQHILKQAAGVTTVSDTLLEKIISIRKKNSVVIPNGFDPAVFRPLPQKQCRKKLGLPPSAAIIAYSGSIQRVQGIHILLEAFKCIRTQYFQKEILLVIAGRFYGTEQKYINLSQKNVRYLGSLSQEKIAWLINAADTVVVPNTDNNFTRYCFPYKVVEYMGCNTPIVATAVGDVAKILSAFPDTLCAPDDAADMAKAIVRQLTKSQSHIAYRRVALRNNTWDAIAKKLEGFLETYARC